jgi:MFS family permease
VVQLRCVAGGEAKSDKVGAKAYLLLAFLTLLNVLNFIDRQLIPTLAPKLIEELGLSKAEIGLLYGFVFVVLYTIFGLVLGTVADRYHRPRLIAGGLTLWSALTAASGAAKSFFELALARVFVGVGEATLTPAALSMLSDVFPERKRGFASGVYYAGLPLGVGAGFAVSGWLAPEHGWRACFYLLGAVGLLFVPAVLLLKNPVRAEAARAIERPRWGEIARTLSQALRRSPALWLTILYGTLINYSAASTIHVLTWLVEERGLEFQNAAYLSGRIYAAAGLVGVVLGGYASDWCHERWMGGRLWFLVVKGLFFLPFIYGFYTLPAAGPLFYLCWFMGSLQSTTWYGPVFATVQDLAPPRIRATIVAFLLLVINLFGTGLGPWITGMIADRYTIWAGLVTAVAVGYSALIPGAIAARRYGRDAEKVRRLG